MGVIFNAVGAVVCALSIAFAASWKLSLVILLFVPLMVFSGVLQGRQMANARKANEHKSAKLSSAEEGGKVRFGNSRFRSPTDG